MRVPNAATLAPIRPVANGRQQKIVAATVPAEVMAPTSPTSRVSSRTRPPEILDDRTFDVGRLRQCLVAHALARA